MSSWLVQDPVPYMKTGFTYILTNRLRTVYYTGVTNNLLKRYYEHLHSHGSTFTQKYKTHILVYYESFDNILQAIIREKQIKDMNRIDKLNMIRSKNPEFKDLIEEVRKKVW